MIADLGENEELKEGVHARVVSELSRVAGKQLAKIASAEEGEDLKEIINQVFKFQYTVSTALDSLEYLGLSEMKESLSYHFKKGFESAIDKDTLKSAWDFTVLQKMMPNDKYRFSCQDKNCSYVMNSKLEAALIQYDDKISLETIPVDISF